MSIFIHSLLFLLSASIIWFFAGLLVDSVDRVAKRFNQSGFTVAFFVLGFLTSISEISVMVNSTIEGAPQVSAGNLAGASFVILLFIVPLLAILGKGVQLRNTLKRSHLAVAFGAILLPNLFMLDGAVSGREGLVCVLVYATFIYLVRQRSSQSLPQIIGTLKQELIAKKRSTRLDIAKILLGGVFIFIAGHLLVEESVYFSRILSIPSSIIGLILLSIGTNVPELVIAIRSILKKHKDIAFGDYLGSALYNTPVFGLLGLFNGRFAVEAGEFYSTAILLALGLVLFFIFARSRNRISRQEGFMLISFYALFLVIQGINLVRFATN